ncbi:hypothetical protein HU200_053518 [Digitaria exilis]|uniref:Protein kinase domain-containing protein n=1 Tax=Digitaria exilis TaxID=1010633 RepID=A0A835E7P6_9POAL|nr:hypothetical protein HU200_053518 [Digitaria exilis]
MQASGAPGDDDWRPHAEAAGMGYDAGTRDQEASDGLDDTLREAYVLIVSCQNCSIMYRFFMGWKQAEQFREVQKKIDGYIQLYPFISHLDITRRLDKLCSSANPSCSQIQDIARSPYIPRFIGHQGIGLPVFRLSELRAATNNFSSENLIGCGGFGKVYKGKLRGLMVAIKRCFSSGTETGTPLNWPLRFHIIMGIAHGIVYLHEYCDVSIIHRDLKPSNVLLDSHMNPKITDFGLATILGDTMNEQGIRGTVGYVAPEYIILGRCSGSSKSDVYCFGVILLEIICAKRSSSPFDEDPSCTGLLDQAWKMWTAGRSLELVDPLQRDEPRIAEILRCIQIALLCVEPRQDDRPNMRDVILMLSCDSLRIPSPKRRGYESPQIAPAPPCSKEQITDGAQSLDAH